MSLSKGDYLATSGYGYCLFYRVIKVWEVVPGIMSVEVMRVKPSKNTIVSFGRIKNLPLRKGSNSPHNTYKITEKEILKSR